MKDSKNNKCSNVKGKSNMEASCDISPDIKKNGENCATSDGCKTKGKQK